MTNSEHDIEELKSLQREATERRAERKKTSSTAKQAENQQSEAEKDRPAPKKPAAQKTASNTQAPESEKNSQDLAGQIETIVKEMEEAASERPMLALLAAFSLGIFVGQLFSRR